MGESFIQWVIDREVDRRPQRDAQLHRVGRHARGPYVYPRRHARRGDPPLRVRLRDAGRDPVPHAGRSISRATATSCSNASATRTCSTRTSASRPTASRRFPASSRRRSPNRRTRRGAGRHRAPALFLRSSAGARRAAVRVCDGVMDESAARAIVRATTGRRAVREPAVCRSPATPRRGHARRTLARRHMARGTLTRIRANLPWHGAAARLQRLPTDGTDRSCISASTSAPRK